MARAFVLRVGLLKNCPHSEIESLIAGFGEGIFKTHHYIIIGNDVEAQAGTVLPGIAQFILFAEQLVGYISCIKKSVDVNGNRKAPEFFRAEKAKLVNVLAKEIEFKICADKGVILAV